MINKTNKFINMQVISRNRKNIIIDSILLIPFLFFFFFFLLKPLPIILSIPLLIATALLIFVILDRLLRQRILYFKKDNFLYLNTMNGSFLINLEEMQQLSIRQNFWARLMDFHVLNVVQKDGKKKKIYISEMVLLTSQLMEMN